MPRTAGLRVAALQPSISIILDRLGALDTLVVNHARSQSTGIGDLTADMLDRTWAVNVRATLLLVQAFAAQFTGETGRVVLFTSGQHRGPMPDEIPYIATKGALHQLTASLADALVDRGITVNCVNPGPTDTGWASADQDAFVGRHMPRGRWNSPAEAAAVVAAPAATDVALIDEAAAVVAMLLGPDAETITGQVVDAEGGFRRWTP